MITHKIFTSIQDLPREQWEPLWSHSGEGYDFFLSQEKAGLEGFRFFYMVLYFQEKIVLFAPLFLAEFNFSLALEGVWQALLLRVQKVWSQFMTVKALFCGSPVSEKGAIGIHPEFLNNRDLLAVLDRALLEQAKSHKAKMIVFKDFMESDRKFLETLKPLGYCQGDNLPTLALPIDFSSMEEYLSKLSHGTRKDLRRKLKQAKTQGALQVTTARNIDDIIDEVYPLYLNVYNKSPLHFERLTKDFFLNFSRCMPQEIIFFLYRANGKLIGFNFCLVRKEALVDKYLGLDYSESFKYNLYFVSFLNNVQWCLDNGKKAYLLGQGADLLKTSLGARAIPLFTMSKLLNPFLHRLGKFFTKEGTRHGF